MAVLRHADPVWIGVALIAIVVATMLGAINSWIIAAFGSGISFRLFLGAYWAAWALGQVVPGQVGDLIGMSLFLRRRGIALPMAVGRLSVDKLISLFCTLAMSAGLIVIFAAPLARLAGLLGACAAVVLLGAFLFSRRWSVSHRHVHGWRAHLIDGLREAHHVAATRPRAIALNGALTILKLFAIGFCYWTVLHALHSNANSLITVTLTANSAGLIAYVPFSANGIGTVEAGGLYLFGVLDVSAPIVLAAYLILRFANLAMAWVGAGLVMLYALWRRRTDPKTAVPS